MINPNVRRSIVFTFAILLIGALPRARAQSANPLPFDAPAKIIPLYDGPAPGSESWTWAERSGGTPANPQIQNVVHPELLYYPADPAMSVGTAVIVCPGGGFSTLMMTYEGVTVAKRFNEMGVDAFVLKYRLRHTEPGVRPATHPTVAPRVPGALPAWLGDIESLSGADGQQAIRLLRQNAADYGFSPDRVGIIGFSAGGAVAVHTVRGDPDGRPNFAAMIYSANATGDPPPPGAPPIFIAVAADDHSVGYQGSLDMFSAWRTANLPAELHIFQVGSHGFSKKGGGAEKFMDRVEDWMRVNGFLGRGKTGQ
jgi:dienelactone hydrolase